MNPRIALIRLSVLLCTLLMASMARALPQWSLDFENATPGGPPPTAVFKAGEINNRAQAVTAQGSGTVLVQSDHAGKMPGPAVVITFPSGMENTIGLSLKSGGADRQDNAAFRFGFDVLIESGSVARSGNVLGVRFKDRSEIVTTLLLESEGNIRILSEQQSIDQTFKKVWSMDGVQRIELAYEPASLTYSALVNGTVVGTTVSQNPAGMTFDNILFTQGSSNLAWSGAIDNIVLAKPQSATP